MHEHRVVKKYRLSMPPRIYGFDEISCKNELCISAPANLEGATTEFLRKSEVGEPGRGEVRLPLLRARARLPRHLGFIAAFIGSPVFFAPIQYRAAIRSRHETTV